MNSGVPISARTPSCEVAMAVLEAELLVLRHQLNVLRRKSQGRLAFSNIDRLVFAGMYALAPDILDALKIVKPETVLRWHRAGSPGTRQ
jgi:hypothetical protein